MTPPDIAKWLERAKARTSKWSEETRTRQYAQHIGLKVKRHGDKLELWTHIYKSPSTLGPKVKLGMYRTWPDVYRAIKRFHTILCEHPKLDHAKASHLAKLVELFRT
jgi:hypothetical protein